MYLPRLFHSPVSRKEIDLNENHLSSSIARIRWHRGIIRPTNSPSAQLDKSDSGAISERQTIWLFRT